MLVLVFLILAFLPPVLCAGWERIPSPLCNVCMFRTYTSFSYFFWHPCPYGPTVSTSILAFAAIGSCSSLGNLFLLFFGIPCPESLTTPAFVVALQPVLTVRSAGRPLLAPDFLLPSRRTYRMGPTF